MISSQPIESRLCRPALPMRAPPPNPPSINIHPFIHRHSSLLPPPPPNYCLLPVPFSPSLFLSHTTPRFLSLIHSPLILTLLSLVFNSSSLFSPSTCLLSSPPPFSHVARSPSLPPPRALPPASLPHIFSMPWLPDRTGLAGAVDLSSAWSECHAVVGPALTPIFRCVCE